MEENTPISSREKQTEEDNLVETAKKAVKGHFFAVSFRAIQKIVHEGGLAEDIMSYLVLARHTQGRGEWQRMLSTSGAKAIHNKTGIPYRKAVRSLEWLEKAVLITPINEVTKQKLPSLPEYFGKVKTRATTIRCVLHDFPEPLIYLANTLVDGTRGAGEKCPPLMRIMDEIPISNHFKKAETRLDAIMLLLHLYLHHELDEFGGVNPHTAIYGKWEHISDAIENLPPVYHPLQKFAITKGNTTTKTRFINDTLFYISNEETRCKRFWNALDNLRTLGFLYEVIQLWDDNPFTVKGAEILYPLYILDRHARQSEPYLAKAIHEILIRKGAILSPDIPMFFEEINTGVFRYLANIQQYPLTIFRLRFRPKVQATGHWFASETSKVQTWQAIFSKQCNFELIDDTTDDMLLEAFL
jgi:hypothetical protein